MNWEAMLRKYVEIIGQNESHHYLDPREWTEEEWKAWQTIIMEENGWKPLGPWVDPRTGAPLKSA